MSEKSIDYAESVVALKMGSIVEWFSHLSHDERRLLLTVLEAAHEAKLRELAKPVIEHRSITTKPVWVDTEYLSTQRPKGAPPPLPRIAPLKELLKPHPHIGVTERAAAVKALLEATPSPLPIDPAVPSED